VEQAAVPATTRSYLTEVPADLCARPSAAVQQRTRTATSVCSTGTRSCRFFQGLNDKGSCRCALAPYAAAVRQAVQYKPTAPAAKPKTSGGWLSKFLLILGPLAGVGLSLYKKHQQQKERLKRPSPTLQSSAYGLFSEVLKAYGLGFSFDTNRRAIVLPLKAAIVLQPNGGATFQWPSGRKISQGPDEALDYLFLFAKRLGRRR